MIIPFALLFGAVATEAGLTLFETKSFSVLVIAGALQFTALQLMADQAPGLIVLATSLAVNLRIAMYSVAQTPHPGAAPLWQRALISCMLVDQTFATAIAEYDRRPGAPLAGKVACFAGAVAICLLWDGATFARAVLGTAIPAGFALDFAVPVTFMAMIAPALRRLPDWLLRHLRYTAVGVMPGLVAPLVLWPPATGGAPGAARLSAAAIAVLAGMLTRSGLWAVICGAVALYLMPVLLGLPG